MSVVELDLRGTVGFRVADAAGRLVGRVECAMYGTAPDVPDALSVRSGRLMRRRLVPSAAIERIDAHGALVALNLELHQIRTFL